MEARTALHCQEKNGSARHVLSSSSGTASGLRDKGAGGVDEAHYCWCGPTAVSGAVAVNTHPIVILSLAAAHTPYLHGPRRRIRHEHQRPRQPLRQLLRSDQVCEASLYGIQRGDLFYPAVAAVWCVECEA